jgi:hypothetical protein
MSGLCGAAVTTATVVVLKKQQEDHPFCGQKSLFGTLLGYCGLPFRYDVNNYSQLLYIVDVSGPTTLMIFMSFCSFLALRARVQAIKSMSLEQSVILYVRFFAYNGYFFLLSVVQTVSYHAKLENQDTVLLVSALRSSVGLGVLSLSFLASERLLCSSLSGVCCFFNHFEFDDAEYLRQANDAHGAASDASSSMISHNSAVSCEGGSESSRMNLTAVDSSLVEPAERRRNSSYGAVNGFTLAIQSMLSLEVPGVIEAVTNDSLRLAEQDALLTNGKHPLRPKGRSPTQQTVDRFPYRSS